jgi:hypothetical protein
MLDATLSFLRGKKMGTLTKDAPSLVSRGGEGDPTFLGLTPPIATPIRPELLRPLCG